MQDSTAKSTRQKVLQTLLKKHRCSIVELADAVEINPISVRHHISKLQADGLVASEEERHGKQVWKNFRPDTCALRSDF
jgi:predicted ArsR family transcriptional regulator